MARYDRLRSVIDLEKGICGLKEAIAAAPQSLRFRAGCLIDLGAVMISAFQLMGHMDDLEMGIAVTKGALDMIPTQDPSRAIALTNLGAIYNIRYTRLGAMHDLELGIEATQEAIATTVLNYSEPVEQLNNLSNMFIDRYNASRALDDIEKAVQANKEAIAATPNGHPLQLTLLSNRSAVLYIRFTRLGTPIDLEKAIRASEEAARVLPSDHYRYAGGVPNTAELLITRFDMLGGEDDLEKALQVSERGLAATPPGHGERSAGLYVLAKTHRRRFPQFGDMSDLEKAMQATQEAVAITPAGHPDRATRLHLHGILLDYRYSETHNLMDYLDSLRAMYSAWECIGSPLCIRIMTAMAAAHRLGCLRRWKEASSLLEDVITILPKVSLRLLGRDDQEYILSEFTTLTALAVSVALYAGSTATHCLGFLELGRGIIMGFSIDCRSDVSELRARHRKIFTTYNDLRIQINQPLLKIEGESHFSSEDRRRHRLQITHEMDEILMDIRQLPGFERFLLPPSSKSFIALAAEGPIVTFISTGFRSDAIIITGAGIKSIRLRKMAYSDVEQHMESLPGLVRGKRSTYSSRNEQLEEFLLWLWDVAVEPVVDELMFGAVKDGSLPHIWWIGVGRLAMAPFHAAGDHSQCSTRNTFCRVISSYISTLKALSYAREKKLELGPESRLLLVAMPTTPDAPPIPGTPKSKWKPLTNPVKEVEDIAEIVMNSCKTTRLDSPTATQVLKELPAFHAIHFACHGISDGKHPSNSHLLLHELMAQKN